MISIIICSRKASISDELKANIKITIGVEHEIVTIDNSQNRLSIFEAYQMGVHQSKGSILCFMHDDILFHTPNWGMKVNRYFDAPKIGAIGIAGSPLATKMPGSWWAGGLVNQQLLVKDKDQYSLSTKYESNKKEPIKPVVVLDGIWLCIRRELFNHIAFDRKCFTGYHFYDIDICLQIAKINYQLFCVFDIEIEHFSTGDVNVQWIENALLLQKKWSTVLPLQVIDLNTTSQLSAEFKTLQEFTLILIANQYSATHAYGFALQQIARSCYQLGWYKKPAYIAYFIFTYLKSFIQKTQ